VNSSFSPLGRRRRGGKKERKKGKRKKETATFAPAGGKEGSGRGGETGAGRCLLWRAWCAEKQGKKKKKARKRGAAGVTGRPTKGKKALERKRKGSSPSKIRGER